ncbi:MAG: TetR/AcrR family transcriptional regulator [Planctomycetota bacterium]
MSLRDPEPLTRRRLLDAAEDLMSSKGFVATSVEEICGKAGVTKGSFFHYFDCKQALGETVLKRFAEHQTSRLGDACGDIEDPLDRVFALIDCMTDVFNEPTMRGCLIGTFAQEVSSTHPVLRSACEEQFGRFSSAVARDLSAAKERYAPTSEVDPTSLGGLFVALVQGSFLVFKVNGDRGQMLANLKHFRGYLEKLFAR